MNETALPSGFIARAGAPSLVGHFKFPSFSAAIYRRTVLVMLLLPHSAGGSKGMCSAAPMCADLMKVESVVPALWNILVLVCIDRSQAARGTFTDGRPTSCDAGPLATTWLFCSH